MKNMVWVFFMVWMFAVPGAPNRTGAETPAPRHAWKDCWAALDGQTFAIGCAGVQRDWALGAGELAPARAQPSATDAAAWAWSVAYAVGRELPVEAEALTATLTGTAGDGRRAVYRFRVFEGVPAVEVQRLSEPGAAVPADAVIDRLSFPPGTWTFTAVNLLDHTDRNGLKDNLVRPVSRPLGDEPFTASANLAYAENPSTGEGLVFVKLAPLPHARAVKIEADFSWDGRGLLAWCGPGVNPASGRGYPCAVVRYEGGRAGRIAALQDYYRCLRAYEAGRDGLLLSNTWGDRSRDAKIGTDFLVREIQAGRALGVDVMEVDDGWQKGTTQNSATVTRSKAGVWSGFWRTDPDFWTPHPARLPDGLGPLAAAAGDAGLHLGLWYAPDSENDFANWERDAERLLTLHREHGVDYFKLDSITMTSAAAEWNVRRMLERVIRDSGGKIVIDLDVTAGVRPGYLGAVFAGPVFVENRYTDWGNYWPHQTLRNFWSLAEHVDPVRLRMEFLNNTRNVGKYKGAPAPAAYPPAYLFASVMFGSPLAWFEVSELPADYAREVGALVAIWKEHRSAMQAGHIIPFGNEPDGQQWCGFASVARDRRSGYILALRETNEQDRWQAEVPLLAAGEASVEVLAGTGSAAVTNGSLAVRIPEPRNFLFLRIRAKE